jgi:hypothetical protein
MLVAGRQTRNSWEEFPLTMGFPRLPSDSIYHPAPDDKESLQDIFFTVGRSISSLRTAFMEFAGGNASVYIVTSRDLVYSHISRIYAVPHLLLNYLTGELYRWCRCPTNA